MQFLIKTAFNYKTINMYNDIDINFERGVKMGKKNSKKNNRKNKNQSNVKLKVNVITNKTSSNNNDEQCSPRI